MASDVTHQPSTTSPSHRPAAVTITTADDPVLDQFKQMRSMISSFLGAQYDSTPNLQQCFYNYLYSVQQYQQVDTPQPFSPSQLQPTLSPVPTSTQQDLPASPANRVSPSQQISLQKPLSGLLTLNKALFRATQIFQNQLDKRFLYTKTEHTYSLHFYMKC